MNATNAAAPIITMQGVSKWYGDFQVLDDLALDVSPGEKLILCGPSGSGKSTTIRLLNRLEEHQKGRIVVDGIELNEDVKNIERIRAEVGMVFQHFNLFPHLTVLENCTLAPLLVKGVPADEARSRAMGYLERVRIPQHADKIPASSRAGRSSAWRSRAPCACNPRSCCSTSPPPPWTLKWSRKCWTPWSPWPATA